MRAKSLILLVIALGCGMIAAVGVSKAIMDQKPGQTTEDTVEIFVAIKDLPHGQKISADSVKLEKWPRSRLPEGALVDLQQIEDKYTNQMIFASEPLLERKLADSRESFSTTIPPGYRVFDIEGSAGYIKPGDHVDILGTFQVRGHGTPTESRTVMRNVQVFGINGVTTRDSESSNAAARGSMFQLLVKESQLEALTLANSMGELRLNLRPFGEDSDESLDTDNGESFLRWVNDAEKEKTKSVQPQQVASVTNALSNLFPGMDSPQKPKHEMVIITPEGMTRYEWSDAKEMPQEVKSPADGSYPSGPGASYGNNFTSTTGNVGSDYAGYKPTYPTSTVTEPTSQGGAPKSSAVK